MTLKELMKELRLIIKVHPQADDAEVWAGSYNVAFHITYVAYDTKHKPHRIELEE